MVAELWKLTNIYQSTHLQEVNFMVCISYLIKAVFKKSYISTIEYYKVVKMNEL